MPSPLPARQALTATFARDELPETLSEGSDVLEQLNGAEGIGLSVK